MTEQAEQPPDADAVFTEEFAQLMGVKRPTIKHYTAQAKAGWPRGRVRPGFPLPAGRVLREVPSPTTPQQPVRRQWVPWWHRAEVLQFLAENPVAPGRRGRKDE